MGFNPPPPQRPNPTITDPAHQRAAPDRGWAPQTPEVSALWCRNIQHPIDAQRHRSARPSCGKHALGVTRSGAAGTGCLVPGRTNSRTLEEAPQHPRLGTPAQHSERRVGFNPPSPSSSSRSRIETYHDPLCATRAMRRMTQSRPEHCTRSSRSFHLVLWNDESISELLQLRGDNAQSAISPFISLCSEKSSGCRYCKAGPLPTPYSP